MICNSSETDTLESLLAGLPGLIPAIDIELDDREAITNLQVQNGLQQSFVLNFERDLLQLCRADAKGRFGRESVALDTASLRQRDGSQLQRACLGTMQRGSTDVSLRVLDLFAGWGMDALSLASGGAEVTSVEWLPVMVALNRDAARRVPPELSSRLRIVHGEALHFLDQLELSAADVIYLDPMFPERKKGALPNKRLQWLAQLSPAGTCAVDKLVELARTKAAQRVVLKRRRKDAVYDEPTRKLIGTSVRYDIYDVG